jgi:hypothetical protein
MSIKTVFIVGSLCCCFACGDDDDDVSQPPICSPVVPCGGDIVGTWDVQSFCLPQDAAAIALAEELPPACSDAFISADATPSGVSQLFESNGTVSMSGSVNLRNQYRFTEACLAALSPDLPNLETACDSVIAGSFSGIQFEDPDVWELSCVESVGACECDGTATVDVSSTGSYTVSGNAISTGDVTSSYCISGEQLTMEAPVFGGDAVAQRRSTQPR